MTKYRKFILLLWICIAIAVVCLVVLNLVADGECSSLPIVSYSDALKNINNYQFTNKQTRNTMTSIADYVVANTNFSSLGIKVSDLTDYAIYMIVSTNVVNSNLNWIKVINDPRYIHAVNGFDHATNAFRTDDLRSVAISVCKNYETAPYGRDIEDLYNADSDSEIFERLTNPLGSQIRNKTQVTVPVTKPVTTPTATPGTLPTATPGITAVVTPPDVNTSGISSTMTMEDGTIRTYYNDGESKSESLDGTIVLTKVDGTTTITKRS